VKKESPVAHAGEGVEPLMDMVDVHVAKKGERMVRVMADGTMNGRLSRLKLHAMLDLLTF
jgi:hypothetical protein